jgi:8-oxo-dGTP pyrophosphatase MutT (NUDIX family)
MNFEPQKFFIGLVDFFTILMPGAMLTYVVKDWGAANLFGLNFGVALDRTEPVIVFLFFSYLLGHFIFLISAILDERLYDPLRALTDWGQIARRLSKGKTLSASWMRRLAKSDLMFGGNADGAVMQAQRIKARALASLDAEDAVNAFQWCKARLLLMSDQQTFAAVQRFEADSKFFRSFFVVLAALTVVYACRWELPATALCLIGMLLAFLRYIDQRFKATQQAYWLVISHEAEGAKLAAAPPRQDGLTHAGGVVYRRKNEKIKFMLVTASKKRSEWVLPKGHIEPGEDPRNTVVREVREETGHWARVVDWLDDFPLSQDEGAPMVRWFLLEACEKTTGWRPEGRRRGWLSPELAIKKANFDDTKALFGSAAKRLGIPIAKAQDQKQL